MQNSSHRTTDKDNISEIWCVFSRTICRSCSFSSTRLIIFWTSASKLNRTGWGGTQLRTGRRKSTFCRKTTWTDEELCVQLKDMHTLKQNGQEVVQRNEEDVSPLPREVRRKGGVLLRGGDEWENEPIPPLRLTLELQRLLLEKLLCLFQVSFLEESSDKWLVWNTEIFNCNLNSVWLWLMFLPERCWWRSICTD